jgi:hypothetical protein
MGRAKVKRTAALRQAQVESKYCRYCTWSDGEKNKRIYESPDDAISAMISIENERGLVLEPYSCEFDNGYHLTKCKVPATIEERIKEFRRKIGIPLKAQGNAPVRWVYVEAENTRRVNAEALVSPPPPKQPKPAPEKPIVKVESRTSDKRVLLEGRLAEVIKKRVDIEKLFSVNLRNQFSASLAKDFLDGPYNQITVHTGHNEGGQIKSYTVFVKNKFMSKGKLEKGDRVSITVSGKQVNGKNVWYCDNIKKSGEP